MWILSLYKEMIYSGWKDGEDYMQIFKKEHRHLHLDIAGGTQTILLLLKESWDAQPLKN